MESQIFNALQPKKFNLCEYKNKKNASLKEYSKIQQKNIKSTNFYIKEEKQYQKENISCNPFFNNQKSKEIFIENQYESLSQSEKQKEKRNNKQYFYRYNLPTYKDNLYQLQKDEKKFVNSREYVKNYLENIGSSPNNQNSHQNKKIIIQKSRGFSQQDLIANEQRNKNIFETVYQKDFNQNQQLDQQQKHQCLEDIKKKKLTHNYLTKRKFSQENLNNYILQTDQNKQNFKVINSQTQNQQKQNINIYSQLETPKQQLEKEKIEEYFGKVNTEKLQDSDSVQKIQDIQQNQNIQEVSTKSNNECTAKQQEDFSQINKDQVKEIMKNNNIISQQQLDDLMKSNPDYIQHIFGYIIIQNQQQIKKGLCSCFSCECGGCKCIYIQNHRPMSKSYRNGFNSTYFSNFGVKLNSPLNQNINIQQTLKNQNFPLLINLPQSMVTSNQVFLNKFRNNIKYRLQIMKLKVQKIHLQKFILRLINNTGLKMKEKKLLPLSSQAYFHLLIIEQIYSQFDFPKIKFQSNFIDYKMYNQLFRVLKPLDSQPRLDKLKLLGTSMYKNAFQGNTPRSQEHFVKKQDQYIHHNFLNQYKFRRPFLKDMPFEGESLSHLQYKQNQTQREQLCNLQQQNILQKYYHQISGYETYNGFYKSECQKSYCGDKHGLCPSQRKTKQIMNYDQLKSLINN